MRSFLQSLSREASHAARDAFRRGGLVIVAGVIGAVGAGFVVVAAYGGLRLAIGPELAALVMGIALLGLAVAVFRAASRLSLIRSPDLAAVPPIPAPVAAPASTADPATMAVFTAAFVLGRRLADRKRF